ncbi:MAG: GDSL-type esterase/lipase family protein [Bacillota bacterium]|nr:GDSL-type esterase/lipase family protein [Bacillota bacterium]
MTLRDLERFEHQVKTIEQRTRYTNRILLYGSSTLAFWPSNIIEDMFSDIMTMRPAAVNHGFGGATCEELWHYYPRLVKPYEPAILIWSENGNDFEQCYTAHQAFNFSKQVYEQALSDFSDLKIIILSPGASPKLFAMGWQDLRNDYDVLLRQYAADNSRCYYIDTYPFYFEQTGKGAQTKHKPIFQQDQTHFTQEGYDMYAKYLHDRLREIIIQRSR